MVDRVQVAKQMDQAALPSRADHRVVGAPEVAHQGSRELLDEELSQGRFAPRTIDHVVGQVVRGEGPQPVGLAGHAPRGLVGMQHRCPQGLLLNLLVPGEEDFLEPPPHPHQTARGELQLQVEVEHVDDLREGVSQTVVQPARHDQRAIAQGSPGQSVGNDRFDPLLAVGTPVAMDRVLGDHRLDAAGNVLGVASSSLLASLQGTLAMRAAGQPMLAVDVDPLRHRPAISLVASLASGPLSPGRTRRFLVAGHHARRRRWRRFGRVQGSQSPCHGQQRQDNRLDALIVDFPCLFLRERRPKHLVEIHPCACSAHPNYIRTYTTPRFSTTSVR